MVFELHRSLVTYGNGYHNNRRKSRFCNSYIIKDFVCLYKNTVLNFLSATCSTKNSWFYVTVIDIYVRHFITYVVLMGLQLQGYNNYYQ